jgi:proline dehydrogenase
MLRSFLIYLSKAGWAQETVTRWKIARNTASRFVAGDTIADALLAVRELNDIGIVATLDHLGEHTTTMEEANQATEQILGTLDEIEKSGIRSNVSIKLTQIGMGLDDSVCFENLVRILNKAKENKNFIRIDMEDSPYTDTTLRLLIQALDQGFKPKTVGLVVQSYLFRTEEDSRKVLERGIHLRLVKGAYKEPAEIAFPKKADADANFDLLTKITIDASLAADSPKLSKDGRIPPMPAIATHDEKRIAFAKQYAEKVNLPKSALEFQMLFGIRRDLQKQLVEEGYPVRVYVPFGTHWYPYFMRRLAERPANIWFFISNFFRR